MFDIIAHNNYGYSTYKTDSMLRASIVALDSSEKYLDTEYDIFNNSTGELIISFCNGKVTFMSGDYAQKCFWEEKA
jgi:hypothetical protein